MHAGRRGRLSMAAWVEPLLYAAAEAAAMREWDLAARALDAFSACVSHGAGLEARVHGLVCSAGSSAASLMHCITSIVCSNLNDTFGRRRLPACKACTHC